MTRASSVTELRPRIVLVASSAARDIWPQRAAEAAAKLAASMPSADSPASSKRAMAAVASWTTSRNLPLTEWTRARHMNSWALSTRSEASSSADSMSFRQLARSSGEAAARARWRSCSVRPVNPSVTTMNLTAAVPGGLRAPCQLLVCARQRSPDVERLVGGRLACPGVLAAMGLAGLHLMGTEGLSSPSSSTRTTSSFSCLLFASKSNSSP